MLAKVSYCSNHVISSIFGNMSMYQWQWSYGALTRQRVAAIFNAYCHLLQYSLLHSKCALSSGMLL
jgi:hypothetical protein